MASLRFSTITLNSDLGRHNKVLHLNKEIAGPIKLTLKTTIHRRIIGHIRAPKRPVRIRKIKIKGINT